MGNLQKQQHAAALVMLIVTAIVWGAGFLIAEKLLQHGFAQIPITLNAIRFFTAALALLAVFCKKLQFSKKLIIVGTVNGALLCGGFTLQIIGLKYTTAAASGFYTAAYALFVPFIVWIFLKKRPTWQTMVGVVLAIGGLAILNFQKIDPAVTEGKNLLLGNMLTLTSALFFAAQIVLSDFALKQQKMHAATLNVLQISVCGVLMVLLALIFESKRFATVQIDWQSSWWMLVVVALFGTAFAYFSQTFAQRVLSPSETAIIIACESPIGAVFAVLFSSQTANWQLCVGGVMVVAAVVLIEILPTLSKHKPPQPSESVTDETAEQETTSDQPPQNN